MAAYIVKVMIEGTHPPVWRRIAVPERILYSDLHDILQTAFGWDGMHLHDFSFPGSDFRVVMSKEDMDFGDCVLEKNRLIDEDITRTGWFRYTYDFGDNWQHKVIFEKVDPAYTKRCATILKWKGDNYNEDVGGVYGAEFLLTDEAKEEYGEDYMEPRSPFDLERTNKLLSLREYPVRKSKGSRSRGKGSASPGPAEEKEIKRLLREIIKNAKADYEFEHASEPVKNQRKPSKKEKMIKDWLDFSDHWGEAVQSAGISPGSAENAEDAFGQLQRIIRKEPEPEQMVLPGIEMPKKEPRNEFSVGNCSVRITTGAHTVEQNLAAHSEKAIHDYSRYLRIPLEKGVKADRIAAIAGTLHMHPEYLRELFTHEQLECILSMAGFRDKRYRLISTDSVEVAIAIGLMESHVSCKRSGWTAELCFASDAKDILARSDGADLEDYYSALHEKDQNVIAILYAYGMIEFEELRKMAKKFAGIRETAADFERYLYWHLRLQETITTFIRHFKEKDVAYAALPGLDIQRILYAQAHIKATLTRKPFSDRLFRAWREKRMFSLNAWQQFGAFVMDVARDRGISADTAYVAIDDCFHLVLSGCNICELCMEFCRQIPVERVSQYVFLWQQAINIATETPLPALMGYSRNEYIEMTVKEADSETDSFHEFVSVFPHEGIRDHMKADTHLFELAQEEANSILLITSYCNIEKDGSTFDDIIDSLGHADELLFLQAMLEADCGNLRKARKIVDGLIKNHKGPVDDLIEFRDELSSRGAARSRRKKGESTQTDEVRLVPASRLDEDYDDIVPAPVKRDSIKIYPNDPCPCGSGKKYKKCCGKNGVRREPT